jgi:hypothetical protein
MQASAESALLAELFSLLPSHIHPLVADNHFADVVSNVFISLIIADSTLV